MTRRPGDVWERLNGEPAYAFHAFVTYRDLGLTRSTAKVAELLGKHASTIRKFSSRHSWTTRVEAWDRFQDEARLSANIEAQRDMVVRHARLGQLAQSKALERLQQMDSKLLTPTQMVQLLDLGIKVERLSRGAPTEHVAGSPGDPVWNEPNELEGTELAAEVKGFLLALEAADETSNQGDN